MEKQDQLDAEVISAFLDEHGVREDCPFCKNENWLLEPDVSLNPIGAAIYAMPNTNKENRLQKQYEAVVMTCSRCGFVRLQDAELIRRWLRSKAVAATSKETTSEGADGNTN